MRKGTSRRRRAERREFETQAAEKAAKELLEKLLVVSSVHEAGHAVADELLREGVEYVEVYPPKIVDGSALTRDGKVASRGISTGYTQSKPRPLATLKDLEKECIATFAGAATEECYTSERAEDGSDGAHIIACMRHFGLSPREATALLERAWADARRLVRNEAARAAVEEIAAELMVKGRVSGDEVRSIVDRNGREEMLRSLKA